MSEIAFLRKPWTGLNGANLAASAAALQLVPENMGFLIRLQRLALIGVSLPKSGHTQAVSPGKLRSLLNHSLINGFEIRELEDPYSDLYSVEIPTTLGPRKVIQGLTEKSGHTAKLLSKAIFSKTGNKLSDEYRSAAHLLEMILLGLSDKVCIRSGIKRGLAPLDAHSNTVQVPKQDSLAKLRAAVTFSLGELSELFPSAGIPVVRMLSVIEGGHPLVLNMSIDYQLILRPFLFTGDGIIITNPGELATSLRHHYIVESVKQGCGELLATAFREQVLNEASSLIYLLGGREIAVNEEFSDPLVSRRKFVLIDDKVIDLFVVTDDFSNYSNDNPFGVWKIENLGSRIQNAIDPQGEINVANTNTLRLVVFEGIGREVFIGFESMKNPGPVMVLSLDELQVMIELEGSDPLFLWRFAEADSKLDEETNVFSWSKLDRFACYRQNANSFYLSDEKKPSGMTIAVGYGLPLRVEAHKRYDHHLVQSPNGKSFVMVHALYGIEIAPIYTTQIVGDRILFLVEGLDWNIWVGASNKIDPTLLEITQNLLEAYVFWMWQITIRLPELITEVVNATGQLDVDISLSKPDEWQNALNGVFEKNQESEWITLRKLEPGHLWIDVSSVGLIEMGSEENDADRSILSHLLNSLKILSKNTTENSASLLEELAPIGNKRILRLSSFNEVLLRAGQLPSPRFIQKAVTAVVLDDLGDWLLSEDIQIGPIQSSERTAILNRVVSHTFDLLKDAISELSPEGLIQYLMIKDEALIRNEAFRLLIMSSRVACFGGTSQLVEGLTREHLNHVEAVVANRFLIEYVSATQPSGVHPITLEKYDYLLALSAEIVQRGTHSDALKYGLSESELSILPSGRLGTSRNERYQLGTKALLFSYATSQEKIILGKESRLEKQSMNVISESTIDSAMLSEFGFTFMEFAQAIGEMISLGDTKDLKEPYEASLTEVKVHLSNSLGWPQTKIEAFLEHLTLGPRLNFLSPKPDDYPWRYNREWSYIRRPIIISNGKNGETILVWGPRRLWAVGRYWIELVYSARHRARSDPMKALLGKIKQHRNRDFEVIVGEALRSTGFFLTKIRVSKIAGKPMVSKKGEDLGDIDVLGIQPSKKLILVVETKDFEMARTPAELANEALKIFGDKHSAVERLAHRVNWILENLKTFLAHYNITEDLNEWVVLPVVVTSMSLLTPLVLTSDVKVLPVEDFANWINLEILGH